MKRCFLLLLFVFTTHTVNGRRLAHFGDPFLVAIDHKETEHKLNLLTELVAFHWEYLTTAASIPNISATIYLEYEAIPFHYYDHHISIQQTVNCLKATYLLEVFEKSMVYDQYLKKGYWLDSLAPYSNGSIANLLLQKEYLREEKLLKKNGLNEWQMATDLLVQSFAPANLYATKGVSERLYQQQTDKQMEMVAQGIRRAIGTVKLINILLDPSFRLYMSDEEVVTMQHQQLYKILEERIEENFKIVHEELKEPDLRIGLNFQSASNAKLKTEGAMYSKIKSATTEQITRIVSEINNKSETTTVPNSRKRRGHKYL